MSDIKNISDDGSSKSHDRTSDDVGMLSNGVGRLGDPKPGLRKDGQPYAAGNEREDGSFKVGNKRPPEGTKFAKGDGKKRGVRPKGGLNARTIWEKKLGEKLSGPNGKKISVLEAVIGGAIRLSPKDPRFLKLVLENAPSCEPRRAKYRADDQELVRQFYEQLRTTLADANDDRPADPAGLEGDRT